MSKKGNNKKVKQMITDYILQGRKLCWFGEDTEIFIAKSEQHLVDTFGYPDPDFPEDQYEVIKNPQKFLWSKGFCDEKGVEPIINWVYGDSEECCQISSSYN